MVFKKTRARIAKTLGWPKASLPANVRFSIKLSHFVPFQNLKIPAKKLNPDSLPSKRFSGAVLESRWNRKSFRLGEEFLDSFPTSELQNFAVRLSEAAHESPVAISTFFKTGRRDVQKLVGQVKLNFSRIAGYGKSVLVEAISGKEGRANLASQFQSETGKPCANFGIEKAIEHARASGFESVGIIDPRSLYWYHKPYSPIRTRTKASKPEAVQKRIMAQYISIAKKMGFDTENPVVTKNAVYWMKRL
jgi:hypothetical protein